MAKTTNILYRLAAVGAASLVLVSAASAQDIKVEKPKIEITIQKTPRFSVSGPKEKRDTQKFWVEVEIEIEADGGRRDEDFIDSLEVKYYITVKPKTGKHKVYSETIKHINIPKGEKIYSVAYMSPIAVAKIIGKDATPGKSDIDVAVEIRHNGAIVAGEKTTSGSSKWWNTMPQGNLKVLPKSKTPFALLWYDRYAEEEGN